MTGTVCRLHKLLAGVVLVAEGGVLLVRYQGMPDHQRGWFLPHDLLAHVEHPDDAVRRVLRDQLAIDAPARLAFVESFTGNDRSWHLAFHYLAELPVMPPVAPGAGVAALQWFPLDALPPRAEVAHHGWALDIVDRALGRQAALTG